MLVASMFCVFICLFWQFWLLFQDCPLGCLDLYVDSYEKFDFCYETLLAKIFRSLSDFTSTQGIIGTPKQQNDQRPIENSSNWETIEAKDCTKTDKSIIEVNLVEVTFEYAAASKIEEDKTAKAGKVDHLIMLYIGIVLATGENGHNKGG